MSTPLIYIVFPFILSLVLYFFQKRTRWMVAIGIAASLLLMLFAFFQDFGAVWKIGPISIEIKTILAVLGRSFSLDNQDKFFLSFVYFFAAVWFGGANIARISSRFIPFGLAIISILTAALAVEPFLYSAILVEIAMLVSIPLFLMPGTPPGKGVLRFIVFQSLAMPLILFGGWLLGGIQASPSDTARLLQAVLFLGIGFALWLAIFPFQSWVPQLTLDIHPFISGFILGLFPVVTMLIMLNFISGLVWLRESQYLQPVLSLVGTIMVVSTGIWAAIEKDSRRLLGYAVLLESGLALLAVSLQSQISVMTLFISFIPRMSALALMALSLSIFVNNDIIPDLDHLSGMIRRYPFASTGLITSLLCVVGFPLLGAFPVRLSLLEQLAALNPTIAIWVLLGLVAFLYSVLSILTQISKPDGEGWQRGESIAQIIFLVIGLLMLLFMGVFPNFLSEQLAPLFVNLPILR
ncbi:MAG: proton-conducting transporter membrane subunit [Ignavibacteria bacterium]|nr:proton-conducting transporter membrane subunit [Ignavibacteria bacterium]